MAITSGFFNSENGDRKYNAAQIGRYLQYIVGNGVFPYVSTSLQVLANDGMTVEVQPGRAMMDYHYMDNDAPITLTLAAGGSQDRIDAIVMYVDMTERACGIIIKEGTPAAAPVAPAMTRTDVRKEYMLAKVRVTKLSSSLTQSSITDTRADSTVCGWVTGLIKQVDTATLFLQWQTAYEEEYARTQEYLAAQQAAWQAFFDSVTHDNVLPAPALTQVGYVLTVNEDGTGYVLTPSGITDTTLTQSGQAADAAATGRAIRKGAPRNLLDNSYFLPGYLVNQRGATTYNTAEKYTIDRWYQLKATNVSVESNGVKLTASTADPTSGLLSQKVPNIPSGKTYTFALKDTDGNIYILSRILDSDTNSFVNVGNSVYMRAISMDGIGVFTIGLYEGSKTIVWAALYEGEYTADNLPVYQPKGYGAELAECQRYYLSISGSTNAVRGVGAVGSAKLITPTFYLPVTMRVTPSIEAFELTIVRGNGISLNNLPSYTASGGGFIGNQAIISLTFTENVLTDMLNHVAMVYANKLVLSADL